MKICQWVRSSFCLKVNGLPPVRRQAITWMNDNLLSKLDKLAFPGIILCMHRLVLAGHIHKMIGADKFVNESVSVFRSVRPWLRSTSRWRISVTLWPPSRLTTVALPTPHTPDPRTLRIITMTSPHGTLMSGRLPHLWSTSKCGTDFLSVPPRF